MNGWQNTCTSISLVSVYYCERATCTFTYCYTSWCHFTAVPLHGIKLLSPTNMPCFLFLLQVRVHLHWCRHNVPLVYRIEGIVSRNTFDSLILHISFTNGWLRKTWCFIVSIKIANWNMDRCTSQILTLAEGISIHLRQMTRYRRDC